MGRFESITRGRRDNQNSAADWKVGNLTLGQTALLFEVDLFKVDAVEGGPY